MSFGCFFAAPVISSLQGTRRKVWWLSTLSLFGLEVGYLGLIFLLSVSLSVMTSLCYLTHWEIGHVQYVLGGIGQHLIHQVQRFSGLTIVMLSTFYGNVLMHLFADV